MTSNGSWRPAGRGWERIEFRRWLVAATFLGPAILIFFGFTVYPVFRTFYNSFFLVGAQGAQEFVGLQNYLEVFADDHILRKAVQHSLIWGIAAPVLELPLAFFLAILLFMKVPGMRILRTAWFAPVLLSLVVVGPVWMWIYNYEWGAVNVVLRAIGLGHLARPWLGDLTTALPALIVVTTWISVGFNMVVLLAAIGALPPSLLEAARIDGAGWWRMIWSIILPLMRPILVNLAILSFISKMKQFALVWVMTAGGPLWSTETVATYIIKRAFHWKTFDLGYPSAVATLWFLVILTATIVMMRLGHRREVVQF